MDATGTVERPLRMTSDDFVVWAAEQPETEHYELYRGEVVPMPAERAIHAITKSLIGRRLGNAIEERGLDCTVIVDDFVVRVNGSTSFEPDVVVCCGPRPADDALWIDDPLIVVEVLSPSTRGLDKARKFAAYMELPSVRHYLIVDADLRRVIHHSRDAAGTIVSRIVGDGPITLDPPGLVLDRFFPAP
jgi:Uma2 family endonuclease